MQIKYLGEPALGFKLLHSKKGGSKRFLNPEELINALIASRLPTTVPNLLLCIYCSAPQSARMENLSLPLGRQMKWLHGSDIYISLCFVHLECIKVSKEWEWNGVREIMKTVFKLDGH